MDKDRIEGTAKQVKGKIKENIGKVTGNAEAEAEGKAEQAVGRTQDTVGKLKGAARDALKK